MADDVDVFEMVFAARRALADTLDGVTEAQWSEQSLCSDWRCRDVLAHLVMPFEVSTARFVLGVVANLGSFDRYSTKYAKGDSRSPAELLGVYRDNAESRFTPPGFGPQAPLTDTVVHGQDICRPLGIKREVPEETMAAVLDFLMSGKAARGFHTKGLTDGLRFEADDLDWSCGEGPPVAGHGEALVVALTGRSAALDDLGGEGSAELRARLS